MEILTYTCVNFAIIIQHQHISNIIKLVMIDIHKHLIWVFASREPHIQVSVIEYTCRQRQSRAVEKFWVKLLLIVFFATYMICSSAAIDHIRAASPIICGGLHLAIVPRPDITFSLTLKRTLARCNYHPFQACCAISSPFPRYT